MNHSFTFFSYNITQFDFAHILKGKLCYATMILT